MTDQTPSSNNPNGRSPGALLRAARERRGMHLAALAAAIKVAPARLEALEADDFSKMPDTTFARALAQAVCRALKEDPAPILALMPASVTSRLERVDEGLNRPFHDRRGGLVPDVLQVAPWRHPVAWLALLLLAAAAAFIFWPRGALDDLAAEAVAPAAEAAPGSVLVLPEIAVPGSRPSSLPATPSAVALPPAPASVASLPILASGVPSGPAAALSTLPANPGEGALLRATQETWVQVTDGTGKVLLARTVAVGEALPFNGPWPMRFRVGNVKGTELSYRGQAVDMASMTRDNTLLVTLPMGAATGSATGAAGVAANPAPQAAPQPVPPRAPTVQAPVAAPAAARAASN